MKKRNSCYRLRRQSQTNNATQRSTQYEFIFMSLNLNEIINKFSILLIIDKRIHSQNLIEISSTISRRLISVMYVNNFQDNVNILTVLRYKFKSISRLKRSFKKSSQTSYQSISNIQNIQNENEWWYNSCHLYCNIMFEIAKITSWFHC